MAIGKHPTGILRPAIRMVPLLNEDFNQN